MKGRSHNYGFIPISSLWDAVGLKVSSPASMATLTHTQRWFIRPKSGRLPPSGGLDSEFPSPRTPAHDWQGFAQLAAAMPGSLVHCCLLVIHS